ncbi:MAG: hypothetical protein UIM53_08485 [Acutalibacteraceae bacterium]|nr:hypothetical protein [Acutalibacteraceae bacterium]
MTISEIQSNINYNEGLIEQFYTEKRTLETQIDELEQLREKFTTLQNNFGSKQESRQQGLAKFTHTNINNKIFSNYFNGMTSLLSGRQFNDAYEGLSTAKQTINTKLQELMQNLTECEGNITYRENRKAYWQEQLRLASTEV